MNVVSITAQPPFHALPASANNGVTPIGTPVEIRVLLAQVLIEQRTAQLVADSIADQQAFLADGTGSVVNKTA